eukprot:341621-Chlamydomonas_euryale.AAC.1
MAWRSKARALTSAPGAHAACLKKGMHGTRMAWPLEVTRMGLAQLSACACGASAHTLIKPIAGAGSAAATSELAEELAIPAPATESASQPQPPAAPH